MLRLVLVGLLLSATAYADDYATYEADGAAADGPDARVTALDDAFARAAAQALEDLVPADVRSAKKADLDREILGHARLWVAKFTVSKEELIDGRKQLTVAVRVDREKMRARLTELNLVAPVATPAHAATVLLRVSTPAATKATYGAEAAKEVAGGAAIASALRTAGYGVVKAPAKGSASGVLTDEEAQALASDAKAEVAAIASVTVGGPSPVRGMAATLALVDAHVKLIDRSGKALGSGDAILAAGADVDAVVARALGAAIADALPARPAQIDKSAGYHGDDAPLADAGVVLVRMPAKTPYPLVLAEQKHLAGAKGVTRAVLRRIGPSGWVIGVSTGEPADRIATIARKPPVANATASAKLSGDIVEVALAGGDK